MPKHFSRVNIYSIIIIFCIGLASLTGCGGGSDSNPAEADAQDQNRDTASTIGCDGSSMLPVPGDPSQAGPWPVGSKYVSMANSERPNRDFRVQVWYPAKPGSEADKERVVLTVDDVMYYFPELDTQGLEDVADAARMETIYYMDLPLDKKHGPYPVIVYVHGTASAIVSHFKACSHWASRGFIVLIADNPGIQMADMVNDAQGMAGMTQSLAQFSTHTQKSDTIAILDTVRTQSPPLDFLAGAVDSARIGLGGHSWGGFTVGDLGDEEGVKVIIPMASGGVSAGSNVESTLMMGALEDNVLNFQTTTEAGYRRTPHKKRLVGIPNAGHMAFSDMCDIVLLADLFGLELGYVASMALDGCNPPGETTWINQDISMAIIKYASTAVFEETLKCAPTMGDALDTIQTVFADDAPGLVYESAPARVD